MWKPCLKFIGLYERFAPASGQVCRQVKKIKVCAFDVDGILTDGRIYWAGENLGFSRSTNIRDGYGMRLLIKHGLKVGVITAGNSLSVIKRFEEHLKLDFVYRGMEDKRQAFESLLAKGFKDFEILYMGDEFFDIPLLRKAGFSATCPEAGLEIKEAVDYVTCNSAGRGCVREVIDMLRYVQGIVPEIPDF